VIDDPRVDVNDTEGNVAVPVVFVQLFTAPGSVRIMSIVAYSFSKACFGPK
jgi:hypothetical protein